MRISKGSGESGRANEHVQNGEDSEENKQ
jgi:hypothetical protein